MDVLLLDAGARTYDLRPLGDFKPGPDSGDLLADASKDASKAHLITIEPIPGSPRSDITTSAWGQNQSKIVRYKNRVFMMVHNNKNTDPNKNTCTFYQREDAGTWKSGQTNLCVRPGNLLITTDGILNAFLAEGDSHDKSTILHYQFKDAKNGNIYHSHKHNIAYNVNKRIGAGISQSNHAAISWGHRDSTNGDTVEVIYKTITSSNPSSPWRGETAAHQLGHNFYYPYVAVRPDGGALLLPISDDNIGGINPYLIVRFLEDQPVKWRNRVIADLSNHPLYGLKTRPRMVSTSDLYVDRNNDIHIIHGEFTDPKQKYQPQHKYSKYNSSGTKLFKKPLSVAHLFIGVMRLFEAKGKRYFFATSYRNAFILDDSGKVLVDFTAQAYLKKTGPGGLTPYLASPRGGSSRDSKYIDVLILTPDSNGLGKNYYVRIDKAFFPV